MRVACIQMCSGPDRSGNLLRAGELLSEAAELGAELALLPENFTCMGGAADTKLLQAEHEQSSPTLAFLATQAAMHGMHIVGGSLLLHATGDKLRNVCPVFDAGGCLLALYSKIHLFDMDYGGESYAESSWIEAGKVPQSVAAGDFQLGLSICYDLRFPELYRHYVHEGCDLLCNVAAFTAMTGQHHWRPLLQARAIENQCYMLAAAQTGRHADGRQTWGHSMMIDPWGEVLAELADGEGVITAELSKQHLERLRKALPALQHRCL